MLRRPSRRIAAANRCPMATRWVTLGLSGRFTPIISATNRSSIGTRYGRLRCSTLVALASPMPGWFNAGGDGLGKQGVAVGGDPVLFFRLHDVELEGDVAQPGLVILEERLPRRVLAAGTHRGVHSDDVCGDNAVAVARSGKRVVPARLRARVTGEESAGERETVEHQALAVLALHGNDEIRLSHTRSPSVLRSMPGPAARRGPAASSPAIRSRISPTNVPRSSRSAASFHRQMWLTLIPGRRWASVDRGARGRHRATRRPPERRTRALEATARDCF